MNFNLILTFIAGLIFLFILTRLFKAPLEKLLKLLINSVLGAIFIYLVNIVGANFSFHIGLNIFTVLFIAILGLPGAVVLIFLQILI